MTKRKEDRSTSPAPGVSDDTRSAAAMLPSLYEELRRVARGCVRRGPSAPTLEPTALVHEAFLRLAERDPASWTDEAHFRALAARAIRDVLVGHARERQRLKRGGALQRITLHEGAAVVRDGQASIDVLALDDALRRLGDLDSREAKVVELRFFGGLSEMEVARELSVSRRTVQEDWAHARLWLSRELA